jgi:hypothetical protein
MSEEKKKNSSVDDLMAEKRATSKSQFVINWKNKIDRKRAQVYVGRRNPSIPTSLLGSDGKYGNPFSIGVDGTREQVLKKYSSFIHSDEAIALRQDIKTNLAKKVLACWCYPEPCHADIISAIASDK